MFPEDAPYKVQLHQADALELAKSGAILLILNVPSGTSFGLNTQMFVVGPEFKGVKMLLPGPHFVYYSSMSRHGSDSSPVTGFFVHTSASQVIVRQWDTQEERLIKMKNSSEEERYELSARNMEFDRQLAPYDLHHHKNWHSLSNFISADVISRLEPVGGDISVMAEAAVVEQSARTPAERQLYEQIVPRKELTSQLQKTPSTLREGNGLEKVNSNVEEEESKGVDVHEDASTGRCFYTHLPHFVKKAGLTASELTALNMDKTQILDLLLEKEYQGEEDLLLGELQFCFIAFLMGQSLEAFGQWKGILNLLLRCEEAPLRTRTKFYVKFLGVIYWQLKQSVKSDTILHDDGWLSEDNFFRLLLKEFLEMLRDATPVDGELLKQGNRLRRFVEETIGWIFEADCLLGQEEDEYAPTVVYEGDLTISDVMEE